MDRVRSKALNFSNEGHSELQHHVLQWTPGLPPHHVRGTALGITEFLDTPWSTKSLSGEVNPRSATHASTMFPNAAIKRPLPPMTSTSTASIDPLIWNAHSATSSGGSIWSWIPDDELAYTRRLLRTSSNEEVQGHPSFLDHSEKTSIGDAPTFPPSPGFGPEITSVDDACRTVQEAKSAAEIDSAVDAIEKWAGTCDEADLEDFRYRCEALPLDMWASAALPQVEYGELLTILPYIREGSKDDGSDPYAPYMALQAAHLLAIFWGKLYQRGVFTYVTFFNGCEQLWANRDFARCDILETVVTTFLREFPAAYVDEVDLGDMVKIQELARIVKMEYLERID